jgi:hypothetical protein
MWLFHFASTSPKAENLWLLTKSNHPYLTDLVSLGAVGNLETVEESRFLQEGGRGRQEGVELPVVRPFVADGARVGARVRGGARAHGGTSARSNTSSGRCAQVWGCEGRRGMWGVRMWDELLDLGAAGSCRALTSSWDSEGERARARLRFGRCVRWWNRGRKPAHGDKVRRGSARSGEERKRRRERRLAAGREDWWQGEKGWEIGLGFYVASGPIYPKLGLRYGPKVREIGFHVYNNG